MSTACAAWGQPAQRGGLDPAHHMIWECIGDGHVLDLAHLSLVMAMFSLAFTCLHVVFPFTPICPTAGLVWLTTFGSIHSRIYSQWSVIHRFIHDVVHFKLKLWLSVAGGCELQVANSHIDSFIHV